MLIDVDVDDSPCGAAMSSTRQRSPRLLRPPCQREKGEEERRRGGEEERRGIFIVRRADAAPLYRTAEGIQSIQEGVNRETERERE